MFQTFSPIVKKTPVVSTSPAYSDGDVVGTVMAFVAPFGRAKTGVLKSVVVKDNANQKAALTILLFDQNPSGGTYTDNAAFAWGAGDFAKCIGRVQVAAADYQTVGAKAIAEVAVAKNVQDAVAADDAASNTNLWAIAVSNVATPTYAAATDLEFQFGFLQD